MLPMEVYKPFTPPSTLPSSLTPTCDTSSGSSDDDRVAPRSRCTHPGRRRIGSRIYDSVLGVTCHWCRQKTVEDHVFCCHCNIAFCGGCLRNRHGEDIEVEMKDDVQWTCPKCRGGCGRGCSNCCNCGPCRKAQGLEPTGLLVHTARARGFTNVHDYLIYQKTGECEEIIERRKRGKGWCWTDPTSFRKKQRRSETESGVETSCRKRLHFTSSGSQSEEKSLAKAVHSNDLQTKEVSRVSNIKKHELSQSVLALKSKEDEKAPPSALKDTTLKDEMLDNVQPLKSKEGKVSVLALKEVLQGVPPQGPTTSAEHDCVAIHKLGVKKELLDVDLQLKNGGNFLVKVKAEEVPLCYMSDACKMAKEELYEQGSDHVIPSANCTGDKRVDQPIEKSVSPLLQVKVELYDQDSLPDCNPANLQADKSDTRCCTTSLDFVVPSQNTEYLSSTPTSLSWIGQSSTPIDRLHSNGDMASPSPSNFHLYPGTELFKTNFHLYPDITGSMPLIKEEVLDSQHLKAQDCKVRLERGTSHEADVSCSGQAKADNLVLLATVKEEREDNQYAPSTKSSMRMRSLLGSVRGTSHEADVGCSGRAKADNLIPLATVKVERENPWYAPSTKSPMHISTLGSVRVKKESTDVPFSIEPILQSTSTFKDERLQVKEEAITGAPMYCIDEDDELQTLPMANKPETSAGSGEGTCGSFRDVSHLWKMDDFKKQLEARLSEPFDEKELEMLTSAASHRKPIYKARETRQGCSQFISEEEGNSYLDHHPDLALRLEKCDSSSCRLSLLRGFFFWLEHASMLGAFKPWTLAPSLLGPLENDDCIEIDGPDCEILAVVCSID